MFFRSEHARGLLKIHFSVLLFGLTGLFGKFLKIPAVFIVLGRVFFACIALGAVFALKKTDMRMKRVSDYTLVFAIGGLLALHWTSFYLSVQISTVAIALLTFSAYPIFVAFIEPFMFGEKIKKIDIIISFIILFGVTLIVPEFSLANDMTIGVLWGMVSCLSYAVMSLLNRKLARDYSGSIVAFYEQLSAAVLLLPVLLLSLPAMDARDWGLLVLLGVVFTGLAHSLFIGGMKTVRAQTAGIIASLESVYGILSAVVFLGEIPSVRELIGGAIILGAAIYSTKESAKTK